MLEFRDAHGNHFRAAQQAPVVQFPNGTILSFSGGEVSLATNEWFLAKQIAEIFSGFLVQREFPPFVEWRALNAAYTPAG
jgi:hypothetical protein